MSKVNLAIIGYGLVGKRHAEAIKAYPDANLSSIVENDPNSLEGLNENTNLKIYTEINELMEKDKPNGVIIATPTPLHVNQAMALIECGIPVLIEKPISVESKDAISLIKKADKLDIPVLVGHHRRHNSIIQKAKEILDKGSIGEIRSVQTTSWFYKPNEYFNIAPWRKKIGAGPVSVNLVHDVDLLRYFCGEVKSVTAHAIKSRRGYENEDLASAILTFKNDIIATISVSDSIASPWSWEMTSKEYPVYHHVDASCYLIGGSDGSLSIPDLSLWKHESKPDWWSPMTVNPISIENTDPLVSQIHNFVQVIKGKSSPLVSGLEGLKSLQIIECIQQSIETFKSITIQDL